MVRGRLLSVPYGGNASELDIDAMLVAMIEIRSRPKKTSLYAKRLANGARWFSWSTCPDRCAEERIKTAVATVGALARS